jgi:hypothetical protein
MGLVVLWRLFGTVNDNMALSFECTSLYSLRRYLLKNIERSSQPLEPDTFATHSFRLMVDTSHRLKFQQ